MPRKAKGRNAGRRDFLKGMAALPVAALAGRPALAAVIPAGGELSASADPPANPEHAAGEKFIGIQIGAVSFVDEGVEKVLDNVESMAGVNALMLAVFTYGRGIAGRQVPGQPLPDHGAQQYDISSFYGGDYATVHAQYFSRTIFKDFRAPDLGDFDVLDAVVPKAKARGIKSYCWFEDVYNPRLLAGFEKVAEVDVHGRRTGQACLNNPYVRDFLTALVEDWTKSYEVDGVMWGSERQGAFNNAIGTRLGGTKRHAPLTCFCEYCRQKGEERGINVGAARQGLVELDRWVEIARTEPRPSDGYFVTLWRVLLQYPEILAWEKLWSDSQREIYALLYGTIKSINPKIQVGWHVWHNNSFNPFYRADVDYTKLLPMSDFIKVVMYNNCGGPRLANYIRTIHSTVFRDATPDEVLELHYRILGYEGEVSLERLPKAGLSAQYVAEETKRALADVHGQVKIFPGIDVDIPTGQGEKKTQPSDVRAAVKAALGAGAPGIILSRKYSEMRLANLAGAGVALRDLALR